jgi:hypothetical protein
MFIIVKINYMNSNRISDICDKVNFTTNYTHFTTPDNILSKHPSETVPPKVSKIIIFVCILIKCYVCFDKMLLGIVKCV